MLKRIGCQVHFVDAWHYHTSGGGVHCGTNVLHEPPRNQAWWTDYAPLANADTTYDPKHTAPNPSSQPTDP